MASIGLCMIVKNEAHIIRRCLESCLPLLDYVLIVDTGSSDGTRPCIRDFLHANGLPGTVLDEPWRDFAHNRSFALQKLRECADIDYGLMIDADEVLVYDQHFSVKAFKQQLNQDLYDLQTRYDGISYTRPQLFSNRLPFYFKGVLHEYLDIDQPFRRETVNGFFNRPIQDSARSRNPDKFRDDAAVLEKALREETDPFLISRYSFYLAQSYRDCGDRRQALQAYLRRARLGGWEEEVYYSLLSAARLMESLAYAEDQTIQAYLAAYEILPARLEALHDAIRCCRRHGKYRQAYLLGKHALSLPVPREGLFLEQWIADYGLLDEFSIAAYWAGHDRECFDACAKLLKLASLPSAYRQRVRENAGYAIDRLGQPGLAKRLPPG
ncbi:MAG: glycosyltransferase family 2 protein [Methylococcales bacterium]|nr:glycosyltransferase family 2 protein [Methylococcales bacterium]